MEKTLLIPLAVDVPADEVLCDSLHKSFAYDNQDEML